MHSGHFVTVYATFAVSRMARSLDSDQRCTASWHTEMNRLSLRS